MVKKARHRLDGMVYAIKVSKKTIRKNSHDEKMAMNEVFAHAALMKHKHVVRYYNSWVESGAVSETEFVPQISPELSIFRSTYRTSTAREEVFRGRSMTSDTAVSGSPRQSSDVSWFTWPRVFSTSTASSWSTWTSSRGTC